MRKIVLRVILLALFITLFEGVSLFAQSTTRQFEESEYYYLSYPIEKIYAHRLGFMIVYRRASNRLSRTYVPHEWFNSIGSESKGDIIYLSSGREWPSIVVYYKNGDFSHVRLKVRRDRSHETWGIFPLTADVDDYFKDLEEVKLEY